jgi:hypothetical protein
MRQSALATPDFETFIYINLLLQSLLFPRKCETGEHTIVTTDGTCEPFFKLLARVVFFILAAESTGKSQHPRTFFLANI